MGLAAHLKASLVGGVQLCELRVEVKPGKAVFITVGAVLVVQKQKISPLCQPLVLTCRSCDLGWLKYLART